MIINGDIVMKITKKQLREIIREVLSESDGHPQMVKNNKEVTHN